jgi:hypothetical protein
MEGVPGEKRMFRLKKGKVTTMSVSAVNDVTKYNQTNPVATEPAKTDSVKQTESVPKTEPTKETDAAVYDKTDKTDKVEKPTYKQNTALVEKLKADAEARTAQMRNLVEKMMMKQGQTINGSMDYLMALKNGTVKVDPATRKQAQEDISEDGYWGVKQTSDRLVSFAKALTGGDPSKADEMMKAIEKGFGQASKAWGGDLPDICQKTLEATREKMEEWRKSTSTEAAEKITE